MAVTLPRERHENWFLDAMRDRVQGTLVPGRDEGPSPSDDSIEVQHLALECKGQRLAAPGVRDISNKETIAALLVHTQARDTWHPVLRPRTNCFCTQPTTSQKNESTPALETSR